MRVGGELGAGLLIDVPQQLGPARRRLDLALTALAGVVWLALWYFGLDLVFATAYGPEVEGSELSWFVSTAAIVGGLVPAWNRFSALRARNSVRRSEGPAVTEALGAHFGISREQLEQLRASPTVKVERPERSEVLLTCSDGQCFAAHHDPLGRVPGERPMLSVAGAGDRAVDGFWPERLEASKCGDAAMPARLAAAVGQPGA